MLVSDVTAVVTVYAFNHISEDQTMNASVIDPHLRDVKMNHVMDDPVLKYRSIGVFPERLFCQ